MRFRFLNGTSRILLFNSSNQTLTSIIVNPFRIFSKRCFHSPRSTWKSHYETLGVSESASPSEIKDAYYELSKELHPDRNSDPDAVERFKTVTAAYDVVGNADKRKNYDLVRRSGFSQGGQQRGSGGGFSSGVNENWRRNQRPGSTAYSYRDAHDAWMREINRQMDGRRRRQQQAEEWREKNEKKRSEEHYDYESEEFERQRPYRARQFRYPNRYTAYPGIHLITPKKFLRLFFFWFLFSLIFWLVDDKRGTYSPRYFSEDPVDEKKQHIKEEEFIKRYYQKKDSGSDYKNSEDPK